MYRQGYWHKREFETIANLQQIAEHCGLPMAQLAIAWILANPVVTSVILGASHAAQLVDTLAAADVNIDAELKKKLDELTAHYRRGDAVV